MSEFEHGPDPEKEDRRHLPIHEEWKCESNPEDIKKHLQNFDYLIESIKDNWLSENQQQAMYEKFDKVLTRLKKSDPPIKFEVKIVATHAAFDASITTENEFMLIQERNHNQKLQK